MLLTALSDAFREIPTTKKIRTITLHEKHGWISTFWMEGAGYTIRAIPS